jgi:chemosensory pili system protein ChpA (sensor histidine kinase/response regulator)
LTQYAGRGVGMDVVASEIKQLGGSLTIDSTAGKGATFRIRLPYTLAVSQAVLVRVAEHTFAIPMVGVQGIVRLSYANYKQRVSESRPNVEYAGDDYEIYDLDSVLGLPSALLDDTAQVPLLMVRAGDLRVALRVDSLLGGREIVVKPVGPQLARIPGVFGATILGDGAVVVILDVSALLRRAAALRDRGDSPAQAVAQPAIRQRPLVLVVDDSITMRKVSARVLEREGYEVQTAKDGLDALEHVHERLPDIILLDLEMPRMDGYEFAGYMRNDARYRDVPIVVITSRVGEKHRARAFELGVNRYLGKPYQEAEMLDAVVELLSERRSLNSGDTTHG